MNNETCIHGGVSPITLLSNLHHSQAGSGRHRCPTCAYEQGFILGSDVQERRIHWVKDQISWPLAAINAIFSSPECFLSIQTIPQEPFLSFLRGDE